MRTHLLLLVTLSACFLSTDAELREIFINQPLVTIDRFETRRWLNRYHLDDDSYTPGGPIFIMTSASEAIGTEGLMDYSYFFDMGREMNALLVTTEHRFYGQSRPTNDTGMPNLMFLETRYAVDDVANLVSYLKDQYQAGAVIAHGFDHGGAIAVWLAHRHPRLVDGLWGSSVTILAEKDFNTFLPQVAEDIRLIGGDECYRRTEEAFDSMERLYASGNYYELEETFNTCTRFTRGVEREGAAFFYTYAVSLGQVIRYSHRLGVEMLCAYYDNHDDPMKAFASFIQEFLQVCAPIVVDTEALGLDEVGWDAETNYYGLRQISYQYCRELGWYMSSSAPNHPFGNRFPIEFFQQTCVELFGRM